MPCCDPKPVPVMVTLAPGAPLVGETLVSTGGLVTVNGAPELETPLTVTTTLPVKAPVGTRTVRLVSLQYGMAVALTPPKETVLEPWAAPKLLPLMVIAVPGGAEVGHMLVIVGEGGAVT